MAETSERKKPFWMDDVEWNKRGLPKMEGGMDVASAVPDLKWVERGPIVGAWVEKDGLLIYHFYKKDRKSLFDQAQEALVQVTGNDMEAAARKSGIADQANAELAKYPWWSNFKDILDQVFDEHFRYQPHKSDFYPEVDSWSVVLQYPDTPTKWSTERLELPFSKVALMVGG